MIKYKTEIVEEAVPIKYICDKCKKEFDDSMDWQEFHHIRISAGYNSPFGDGNFVMCDLCADCLKSLIGNFCRYVDWLNDKE